MPWEEGHPHSQNVKGKPHENAGAQGPPKQQQGVVSARDGAGEVDKLGAGSLGGGAGGKVSQ